jgi:hypothetical protein
MAASNADRQRAYRERQKQASPEMGQPCAQWHDNRRMAIDRSMHRAIPACQHSPSRPAGATTPGPPAQSFPACPRDHPRPAGATHLCRRNSSLPAQPSRSAGASHLCRRNHLGLPAQVSSRGASKSLCCRPK